MADFTQCSVCKRAFRENIIVYDEREQKTYCGDCYDKKDTTSNYYQCSFCGNKLHEKDGVWRDHGNMFLCKKCSGEKRDYIDHPSHYTFSKYEVFDILMAWFPDDPLLYQVGKYIARAKHKGKMVEDLKKARWYLDKAIERGEK